MNALKNNLSTAIYSTAEIREIEHLAAGLPGRPQLMEAAGLAAAEIARDRLLSPHKPRLLVLAGPGNNGGDAFVAARHLREWGFKVTLVFTGEQAKLSADALRALNAWVATGAGMVSEIPENETWDAVIDGLFGIGLDQQGGRELGGKYLAMVNTVNAMMLPVLSIDIPSGLGSDTGAVCGAAIIATMTATFIGLKPGLFTNEGPDYCGKVFLHDLDLDVSSLKKPDAWLMDQMHIRRLLPPPRRANSHKGMFGSIGVIGGTAGMVGAALLAGTAALKLGAGRVYLGLMAPDAPAVDTFQPELMLRPIQDLFKLEQLNCLVVGPGLGTETAAYFWLKCALQTTLPLVLDADGLNLVASHSEIAGLLRERLRERHAPSILTPHPAEAARLLKSTTTSVQQDRMAAAAELAQRFNCWIVLKGAGSVCAMPEGRRFINTSGNPGLSSAGTGDILSGMIGAFLAQRSSPENALLAAVYLHGAAADVLQKQYGGGIGMTASEIPNVARNLLNQWIAVNSAPAPHQQEG
ncbi:yjeF C-terminal region, hydroxyethylthiazole kinase-related/yjeF N-terminal region [Nitrosospira multiformis ATCC 25196]|uniref:Bifunctional NAD(P)H-hydrate repair enzyme n=1 Tax=Nitrosospira multiformis (strain ATCC 25196 / NCIMB 11849 / C 71) TaxID=323848 RepID=Q2Y6E8_NITMU|nr:bifunctional ADP-dependent NAD(P)H-hydrate dehydratase/NAD(P)H-hydrate epimerase [Nitrosospira multiformis]ABB75673.1 conserved hypothetical protein [Nitrosospira multiformis ATCC 25196]SEF93469.1 yjeF C-terminal region, hydroxyethylthiazole kinase-related/yjeF N-terminal region [Nitrosospira multiformis ATCC 25196]